MIARLLRSLARPFSRRSRTPAPPRHLPPLQSQRVHLFAGQFPSEAAATDYALGLSTETLARDLDGAAIGPDDVEIVFGAARIAAARPQFHGLRAAPAPDANTLILLSDRGYPADQVTGGRVAHLGLCDVS